MSIRPIDMQISIATMNSNTLAHQQANQVNVDMHNNVAKIRKDQENDKNIVKDTTNSDKLKSLKEDDEEKDKLKKKEKEHKKENDDNTTNNDSSKDDEKESQTDDKEDDEEKKKRYIYTLDHDGKVKLKPEDSESEHEGKGHIDLKA